MAVGDQIVYLKIGFDSVLSDEAMLV